MASVCSSSCGVAGWFWPDLTHLMQKGAGDFLVCQPFFLCKVDHVFYGFTAWL